MKTFCGTLLAFLSFVAAARAQPELRNGVAAIVNDSIITFHEVEAFTAPAMDLLRRTYWNRPEVYQQKRNETLDDGLEQLLERELILDDFEAAGGVVPDSIIDDEIRDKIRERFGDRATFTKTLRAEGISTEMFRKRLRDDIIVRYMREKNVGSAIIISPQKIETYYATNQHKYQVGEEAKLRIIVLSTSSGVPGAELKKLGLEIISKLDGGTSFKEMAGIYSEGSARNKEGDWGWVERHVLNRGLADVAFALQPGERSGLIGLAKEGEDAYWIYLYDQEGRVVAARKYTGRDEFVEETPVAGDDPAVPPQEFYLMLVEDRRPARVRPLSEVRDEIEKELLFQEREKLRQKWVGRLKEKAFVRYF